MQNQTNIRIIELLRFLYQQTDEAHPATVSDILAYLKERNISAVRQTVYADLDVLIAAGIDIVVVKSTQNQYFIGSRIFEYPELKMLTDAVASSKIISATLLMITGVSTFSFSISLLTSCSSSVRNT